MQVSRLELGRTLLLALVVVAAASFRCSAGGEQADRQSQIELVTAPSRSRGSSRASSSPAMQIQEEAHSEPGERFQETAGRGASATSRPAATTTRRPRHDGQSSRGRATRPEAAAGQRKTNGLERSAALESLTGFLLERPHTDTTAGATYRQNFALGQRRSSQPPSPDLMALDAQEFPPSQPPATSTQLDQLARLYLDSSTPLEVRVHLGETARLHCKLRQNLDHSDQLLVSWFRNVSILTSGEFRYTSDERFKPSHKQGSNDWLLELENVRASDEGDFECQVNSAPRAASVRVRLVVIVAQLEIVEGVEVRADEGGLVELTCRVRFGSPSEVKPAVAREERAEEQADGLGRARRRRHASSPFGATAYIYWYKDQVYLQDHRIQEQSQTSDGLEKVLRIERAAPADSGSYTCKLVPELTQVQPASARVVVASSGASDSARPTSAILIVVLTLVATALSTRANSPDL